MMNTKRCTVGLATLAAASVMICGSLVEHSRYENKYEELNKKYAKLERSYDKLKDSYNFVEMEYDSLSIAYDTLEEAHFKALDELHSFIDPVEYNIAAAPLYDIELSEKLQQYTYNVCRYYNIEKYYETILAVMWQESGFNPRAVSSSNDYGIMQINKCNHADLQENLGIVDFLNAKDNIRGGVYIFYNLINTYKDIDKALMAYNLGPGGASEFWRSGIYTSSYSRSVRNKEYIIKEKNI